MRISSGLCPGQVLQRLGSSATADVAGSCSTAGPVTARVLRGRKPLPGWSAKRVGKAAGGTFAARLAKLPVGGPYRVELSVGTERLAIDDIFVGDVWIMAGQSNMEGIGNLADAPESHPLARCLHTDGVWREAKDPLHLLAASPDRCHAGSPIPYAAALKQRIAAGKGTGVGVWFAREMLARDPKVPQGLIACAHGGTSMAQWNPALKGQGGDSLYGSMMRLWGLTGQPVAGMLWYQGCSDCSPEAAAVYTKRMQDLVAATRRDFGLPKLPWLIVQIAQVVNGGDNGRWWEDIREQQRVLPTSIRNLAVVAAIDLNLDDGIHIGGAAFAELGRRLARQAARLVLGDRRVRPEPDVAGIRVIPRPGRKTEKVIEIRCRDAVGGLVSDGHGHGFVLLNGDGRRLPVVWRVNAVGSSLHLYADSGFLTQAESVLYGPGISPHCSIRDGRGAALPAFGPLPLVVDSTTTFLSACRATDIQTPAGIADLPFPAPDALPTHVVTAQNGFINQHPAWQGRAGWAACHFVIDCPDAIEARLLLGYDGPFRLAIDGVEVHRNMHGTNPAIADSVTLAHRFTAGRHQACVLMDLNGGNAWGFWFRLAMPGITPAMQRTQGPALPTLAP